MTTNGDGLQQRQGNVPWQDQRSHTTLVDERYIEMLSRLPPGLQDPFGAFFLCIEEAREEARRLEGLLPGKDGAWPIPPNDRGDIRILKGTTTYVAGIDADGKAALNTVNIWSVIPAIHVPLYAHKARVQATEMESWALRQYRLLIGEGGKGRQELIDALNASTGRLLPPSAPGPQFIQMPANPAQPQRERGFAGLKHR